MTYMITAIRDAKTGFLTPGFHASKEAAVRDFISVCRRPDTAVHEFPVDFSLVFLGSYDTDTGSISPVVPDELCRATSYVKEVDSGV